MTAAHTQLPEVGGQADLADPHSVLGTIEDIFNSRFGKNWPRAALTRAIDDAVRAYGGHFPGLLACDTPYHDLRHTLDTALVMARLLDGHEASHQRPGPELGAERCIVGVLLALFHDIGFLRREGEEAFTGAQLVRIHEARGIEFTAAFFERAGLRQYQPMARLILATAFRENLDRLFVANNDTEITLACMTASADVLSQLSDRFYLERCRDFLYQEFVLGGMDRITNSDGVESILYQNAEDLLRKTPWFFEAVIMKRLEHDLRGTYRYLDDHFGGQNPYVRSMFSNIEFLKSVVDSEDFSRLRRHPQPLFCAHAA
jgi:hypothetical protein